MRYNPKNWYWSIAGSNSQVWSSSANGFVATTDAAYAAWLDAGGTPTAIATVGSAMGVVINQTGLLDESDTTMHRIVEAVALGFTTMTAADVVSWVNWRRALRTIISGTDTTSTSIPARPAYPSGT